MISHWGDYKRVGIDGTHKALFECPKCHALTMAPSAHDEWHDWQNMSAGEAAAYARRKAGER